MNLQGIEAFAITAGNRGPSQQRKRCGSSVSTPFTLMVSTYTKGMTNFPFFLLFSFSTDIFTFILHLFHRNFTLVLLLFYICFTFVLHVSLFVGFVLHPLSDSLLFTNFIISSSSQMYLCSYSISFCPVPGPVPDSAFYIFFFCVNFTPD